VIAAKNAVKRAERKLLGQDLRVEVNGIFMSSSSNWGAGKGSCLDRPDEISDKNVTFQATKAKIERKIAK
jgi:hypothetical protein